MKHFFLFPALLFPVFALAQQIPEKTDSTSGKRVIKIDFIAPLTGNFTIGYEQAVSKSISLDFQLGIIGAGKNPEQGIYNNVFGLFLKAGPCLYFAPNYEVSKSKTFSRFQGTYIKPTLSLSVFSYNVYEDYYYGNVFIYDAARVTSVSGAFLLNIGHQFVFDRILSFNFYGGVGYYIPGNDYDDNYLYSYVGAGSSFPIAFDGGIEIGLVSKR